ncbi:Asp-tRNA(Asn)/Glu-tRNA(Gln) amidotransferase subunit GatC [Sporosarcina sp. Marseille-Q4063]|uniref:Asp-tRNA(Asn)/Glu-tRNA(Gln) amidotransferase subunit GatC n=1 Tax=Sporosarcina sp. Marseille-Q4063 TaxID=2810514 RepID=UPI001BB065C1|nr:Asp-tRNA(Asn)/Glu-tRNA(Gln) amidotransferase subunit GatC [Sporosarcina sp. Marseille-Q4063]QUW23633.1 Asp-tRNA(Asn)/Glu-tRNA(Gln) amidotransferase subunit GatC [Sporosarcina sp. Marseille-Q4063]
MTKVTKEELLAVADRAMLELTDEEADVFTEDLATFIGFADKLNELDLENVVPMTHALQQINVMREDVERDVLDRDEMLKSVKEHQNGEIKVPTILS